MATAAPTAAHRVRIIDDMFTAHLQPTRGVRIFLQTIRAGHCRVADKLPGVTMSGFHRSDEGVAGSVGAVNQEQV